MRVYADNAQKQRAYRERAALSDARDRLRFAIYAAACVGDAEAQTLLYETPPCPLGEDRAHLERRFAQFKARALARNYLPAQWARGLAWWMARRATERNMRKEERQAVAAAMRTARAIVRAAGSVGA